jgi:hypothetical protein
VSISEQQLADVVTAIQRATISPKVVELASAVAESGGAKDVISGLLTAEKSAQRDDADAVYAVMAKLEALGEASLPTACAFMAELYPFASRFKMHDVANAIDLWIADANSKGANVHRAGR